MKTVILISGKRWSGKDKSAEIIKQYISENTSYQIDSMALAYATKVGYCKENNLNLDRMVHDQIFKESHRMGLLDYYLTNNDPKWYADYVLEYMNTKNDIHYFIIPDLRIIAHADIFKSPEITTKYDICCVFIRINSSNEVKKSRGWIEKECDKDHTEIELDDYVGFDFVINNNGTLDELKTKLIDIVKIINV
jgi:phosphomevalonate kinase